MVVMLEEAKELLETAALMVEKGEKYEAVNMVEMAVNKAVAELERAAGQENFGESLQRRLAKFTDNIEIINYAKVIEDIFDPTIYPVGFDAGTEEPSVSFGQALIAVEYGRKIVDFVESKINELTGGV